MIYRGLPEIVAAMSQTRFSALPEELRGPMLDLMAGTKDEQQDHVWQGKRCLLNNLLLVPEQDRIAAGL
jgi:hypothetical protein